MKRLGFGWLSSAPLSLLLAPSLALAQAAAKPSDEAPSAESSDSGAPSGEPAPGRSEARAPAVPVAPSQEEAEPAEASGAVDAPSPDAAPAAVPAPEGAGAAPASPWAAAGASPASRAAEGPPAAPRAAPVAAPARFPVEAPLDSQGDGGPPPRSMPRIEAWLGFESAFVGGAGFDAFSDDDALTQGRSAAAATLADLGGSYLAASLSASYGSSESSYRGQRTELSQTKLAFGPELRLPIVSALYGLARVEPTLSRVALRMRESSAGTDFEQREWILGADAALGFALRFASPRVNSEQPPLGAFLRLEAGYSFLPERDVALRADGAAPVRTEPLHLDALALRGFSVRGALGVGY